MSKKELATIDTEGETGLAIQEHVKVKKPSLYKVILLNDDYTPMDFVIEVSRKIFRKNHTESTEIMLKIHNEGKGVCGTYPKEIAETKMTQVVDKARNANFPLRCTIEKD